MVVDSLHWVSLGNGDKNAYIEDINNRLELSKEKYKQTGNSKKSSKPKSLKSFNFSSLTNIHKSSILNISLRAKSYKDKSKSNNKMNETNLLDNSSNSNNLNVLFSDLFTDDLSYRLAFNLLQEEYQLQGYQDFNKEFSNLYQKTNSQNSSSDISSYNTESNSTSFVDINQEDVNNQNASQSKHQAALTFPRNRKINIFSHNNNETNLANTSSTALSVPNLKSIDNKKQCSKISCSCTEINSSFYNLDNISTISGTMNSLLSESTIANNSINNLSSNYNLSDNESEIKKYSSQRNIKKVQVNTTQHNNASNKNPYANVPKFCPFTFWMKDFEECAKEYNQLFLGNNLSSKIIYNTIANKTYRWAPMVSTPKETVDQEQAINYIVTFKLL